MKHINIEISRVLLLITDLAFPLLIFKINIKIKIFQSYPQSQYPTTKKLTAEFIRHN